MKRLALMMHNLTHGELVIPGDEIPADPAAAADFCAEQDEALHMRGFMRIAPWQELPSGDWTAAIAPVV
jgi:hypothetical protein